MRGKGLGESGGASLQGKGGREGFRKVSLMVKRDGVILERPLFRVREDGRVFEKVFLSIFTKNEYPKLQQTRACNALFSRQRSSHRHEPSDALDQPQPVSPARAACRRLLQPQ